MFTCLFSLNKHGQIVLTKNFYVLWTPRGNPWLKPLLFKILFRNDDLFSAKAFETMNIEESYWRCCINESGTSHMLSAKYLD